MLCVGCASDGISSDTYINPAYQIPVVAQAHQARDELTTVAADTATAGTELGFDAAHAALDVAEAVIAAPFRMLFGMSPFPSTLQNGVTDERLAPTSPEDRLAQRRAAMGLPQPAENRVATRRAAWRRTLENNPYHTN